MVDHFHEGAYHEARQRINPAPCAFEKALLVRCASCSLAEKHLLAERETINCRDPKAKETCDKLRTALRSHLGFVFRTTGALDQPLPHALEMRTQCGGLKGLQQATGATDEVDDVHRLLVEALNRFGGLDDLPYASIVQGVSNFNVRRRR
jgi:hypothetical protein